MFFYKKDINIAYQIRRKAEKNPEIPILTFEMPGQPDVRLTYGELIRQGERLAGTLDSAGIGCGDTFAVMMQNRPEIIVALYAALVTGAVMVPIDPRFGREKLAYLLRQSHAKGILFSPEISKNMDDIFSVLPDLKVVWITNPNKDREVIPLQKAALAEKCRGPGKQRISPTKSHAGDHAMILFTSGTTGIPKGVMIRTDHMYRYLFLADHVFHYTPEDRLYTGLPLTHGNAYFITILPSLVFGIPAVISQGFDTRRIWDICRQYNCTIFSLLGGLATDIFSEPERADDAVNPVRKVVSAGTPCQIWKAFEARFKVTVHEWYGTLEGGFAHNPPGTGPVGSFGKPVEEYQEMTVVREDDAECRPGEIGELMFRFRDDHVAVEYHAAPAALDDSETDKRWFRTGDMVHRDKDGWLFFDYRKGHHLWHHDAFISFYDVESVFLAHPEVGEVCVYGIEADSGAPGEHELVAAIIPRRGATPDVRNVFEFCAARLTAPSMPSYLQLVDAIPKTPTEKVIRRLLKEEFEAESPNVYRFNF